MNKELRLGRKFLCLIIAFVMIFTLIPRMPSNLAYAALDDGKPIRTKDIKDNGDGTYKLSLDVLGDSENDPIANKANVVIVLDTSGSMDFPSDTSGQTTADWNEIGRYGRTGSYGDYNYWRLYYRTGSNGNYTYYPEGTGPQSGQRHSTVYYAGQMYNDGTPNWQQYNGTNRYNYTDNTTRLEATKVAVKNLVATLLAQNAGSVSDMIEISYVTFSSNAHYRIPTSATSTGWVSGTSTTALDNAIDATQATGATNWVQALTYGDNLGDAKNDGDDTYIVFFSDGEPTTGGDNYNGVADTIYRDGYSLYGIFAYGDTDDENRMHRLVSHGNYGDGNHVNDVKNVQSFAAANQEEIEAAFAAIASAIANAVGLDDVSIKDGTTNKVSATSELSLLNVVPDSYDYYLSWQMPQGSNKITMFIDGVSREYTVTKSGSNVVISWDGGSATYEGTIEGNAVKIKWDKATGFYNYAPPAATFNPDTGAVDWSLEPVGTLLDEVTYTVTFDVYPSQTALDYRARLENGEAYNDVVPEEARDYFHPDGTLETNTAATLTYTDTRTSDGEQTVGYENPDPVKTQDSYLSVKKEWEGGDADVDELELTVLMDDETFHTVTLSATESWTASSFISAGIIKNGQALEGSEGHDFSFAELGDEQYHWELDAPTVRPMLVDGTMTMLIKVDDDHKAPSGADTYTIDGATYYADPQAAGLVAVNHRRSNLNLKKVVTGEDAPADATFPFTLTVNNAKAENGSEDDTDSDYYVWFSIYDTVAGKTVTDATVTGATGPSADGYYYAPSGSGIGVEMKAGWNLRFTNLPQGTTYEFVEGTTTDFQFAKAENTGAADSSFEVITADATAKGTIQKYDANSYEVTYTNNYSKTDVEITKVWEDNDNQDGKRPTTEEFKAWLTLKAGTTDVTADNADKLTVTGSEDEDGNTVYTAKWTGLTRYEEGQEITYSVTETPSADYEASATTVNDHGTITNTHEPEVTDITVNKIWIGPEAEDGAVVTLKANGTAVSGEGITNPVTLSKDSNNNTYTWEDLPKYANGTAITYTVEEAEIEGFTTTGPTGDAENGFTFTNTNDEKVSITVKKKWEDDNNRDGARPAEVTVNLKAGGAVPTQEGITAEQKLTAAGNWTYTWEGLYKYDRETGDPIIYTVTENSIENYTPKEGDPDGSGTANDPYLFTNIHEVGKTSVTVTKSWEDAGNQDGIRPASVEVTLFADGEPVTQTGITAAQTLNEDNNWTYTWTGLNQKEAGTDIVYTVQETTTDVITGEDGTGTYAIAVTGDATEGFTVTNTHTPEKTEVTVNKIWAGDEAWKDSVRPDSITVNLLADGEAAVDYDGEAVPAATVEADDEGNWTYTFTNLPKYKDGNEIVYTSKEAAVAGYDTTYSNDKLTITNTYNPTPTTATFDVTKNLVVPEGLAGPDEWSYKFKATQGEGAPAPAVAEQTVDQDKTTATFTFAENAFTKPGTYTYTVTEEGTYAYITNDAAAATGKTVTITVTGDKQGRLTAAVTGADEGGKTTTFTNTYKITTPDIVDPPVKKVLNGTDIAIYDGQFTFKIEGKTAPEGVTTIPMPTNTTITNSEQYAKDVEGETFYEFGNIEYTVPGTYTYEISEVSGTLEEITYDTNKYTMTVEVVDNGDGTVTATMTPEAGKFVFTNVYSAEGSATLEANKVLSGREWKEGETFTFELRDANGATVGQPVQVSKDNPKATFTLPYTLEDVGEHKYTITETGTLPSGVTKSADIKATVTVSDAGAGELSTSVAYEDDNNTITNTYEATSVKAAVNVSKTIDGYIAGTDDNGNVVDRTFNFTMTGPKIDGQLETSITTSNGEGTSAFNEIEYTLADLVDEDGNYVSTKDFVYTVTETAGSDAGFTYDDKTYNVTVTVTDDQNGKLSATVKYADEDQTSVEVVNEYEMTDAKVTLTLTKTIEDQSNSAPDGTFTFKLYKESVSDDNFVEEKTITTENLTGSVDFSELTFDAADTYKYVVVEEAGDVNGFTYDTAVHEYEIVIDNDFNAAVLLLDEENSTLKAEITNVYKAEEISNALKVKKEINDTSGSAYETTFTFTLTGPNEYTDEVTVTGAREGTFKAITYDKAGTYEYTIKETKGDAAGYQYDETEYKVKVTVEDVDGKLVATAAYIDKEGESQTSLTITNTYDPEDAKITLEARKIVDDQTGGATAKTFTFELVDAEGKVISTKSIQGGGTVQFDEQTYSKVGEYKYNIHEVKGSDKGYTYDTKDYPVTVTVTDPDKDGRLKAEATEGAEIVITNTYKADPTKATIELTKELTGRDMNEGEFTFTLTDLNGEEPDPIQTATNTADGKVVFDEIEYTVSGEFNYEVSEVVPEETKGVTYDQNKIKVTVNVIDDGEGALKAEVVYPANATFKNVYEAAGSFTPEAKKVLENKALTDGQFSFKIEGPEGKLPANTTVTNKADGTITFGEIKYDQTDAGKTYEYTITEVKGSLPEITYDSGKITLKVTVEDNGDGTLKVTGVYGSKTSFTNKYTEPKTGDTTIVVPYIVIGVSSLILLLMLLFRTRKNRA